MQKTGLWSSGGKGSQGMTATARQHTTNQGKPVGKVSTKPPQGTKIMYIKRVKETNPMRYTNPAGREYYFPESISREEALERMAQYAKKAEQDERSGQQLFDDMFGG